MSDSYGEPQQQGAQGDGSRGEGGRGGGRGGRGGGNREGGGFRIRLSDNEMRSARALQEAFNLRSTVAVLGFALRTLGQMLEDGQLDELIEQQRNQALRGRREGGGGRDRDGGGRDGGGRGRRGDDDRAFSRGNRPDPFARPSKPQPEPEPTPEPAEEAQPDADAVADSGAVAGEETTPATDADSTSAEATNTDETTKTADSEA